MHIVFIYPAMSEKENYRSLRIGKYIKSWSLEPLTIATLKGSTPAEHQCTFYDDRVENIDFDINCDLVAITCETFTAQRAYEIAKEFRKRDRKIVMGGFHPSLVPDESQEHCDALLIGEGEYLWPQILKDLQAGNLQEKYIQEERVDPADIRVDKRIFKGKKYLSFSLIETGRGCQHKCEFCAVTTFFKYCYKRRPVEHIIEEVKRSGRKRILFVDDNITAHIPSAKELFRALIPLKIQWFSQMSLTIAQDDELLDLMQKSGCAGGLFGFESLNRENLKHMKKTQNLGLMSQDELIDKIYSYGMRIYGSFILGYDEDSEETVKETLDYAINKGFFIANFYQLTVFPGTELYARFQREGKLKQPTWWLDPTFRYGDIAYEPKKLNSKELTRLCHMARREFYSIPSIVKRGFMFRINRRNVSQLFYFFLINLLTRTEARKRQKRKLGRA